MQPSDHGLSFAQAGRTLAAGMPPLSILLAEDSSDQAFLFLRALKKLAFPGTIHHVEAGDLAIDWLRSLPESQYPSLIVLDLKMPRVDGLETLQWIRSQPRFQSIPTFIFSSSDLPSDRAKAERLGASGYYTKPSAFGEHQAVIASMLSCRLEPRAQPADTVSSAHSQIVSA